MKKYIIPLLLIALVAASCKKKAFHGAPEYYKVNVTVTHTTSSSATLSISTLGFTPDPSGLKIINKDSGKEMSFTTSGSGSLSTVKLQGLQSSKKYTIYVVLPDKNEYGRKNYVSKNIEFTTTR